MALKTWTLVNAAHQKTVDDWQWTENGVQLVKKRLCGGVSDGVDVLEIDNGRLSLTLLLTRGMGIWRGQCGDVRLQWDSPVCGPVHPAFVPLMEPSGLGWLYGFDEWLVRCGLKSNGSPRFAGNGQMIDPLHGRIANIPASRVEVSFDSDSGEIVVEGTMYESRLFEKKLELKTRYSTKAGEAGFRSCDTVTNRSAVADDIVMLYHINTGLPFLGKGSRVIVPFEEMAPRSPEAAKSLPEWQNCDESEPGVPEVVYFFDPAADSLGNVETLLVNGSENQAISFGFNKKQLPCLSFWKSRLPATDGYVVGVEPGTNFPNTTPFERKQGRTVNLAPEASQSFDLVFRIFDDAKDVADAEKRIQSLHDNAARKITPAPKPEWTE
ncbi:MAG: aldose 1-epimerase family protein [Planctomycetaceae bacterium]|nr:aldose 1-epimerase family protein [Planctomycetaceae bacterium]